jgi:hypothetical protein
MMAYRPLADTLEPDQDDTVSNALTRYAQLRTDVAIMRELGVLEWDGIKLGPLPQPSTQESTQRQQHSTTPEEEERRARMRRRALGLAAASGVTERVGDSDR